MDTEKVTLNGNPYTSYDLPDSPAWRPAIGYLFELGNGADIGLELGYATYPNNEYVLINGAQQTFKGRYVDLLGVAKLHFNNTANGIYGVIKGGTAFMTQEFQGEDLYGTVVTNNVYGTAPELGIGIGYDFQQTIGIDATVSRVFANSVNPDEMMALEAKLASVTTAMVGVTLRFPM